MSDPAFDGPSFDAGAFDTDGSSTQSTTASIGGLMTILLLAQPASRRQRQIVYGPRFPTFGRRK